MDEEIISGGATRCPEKSVSTCAPKEKTELLQKLFKARMDLEKTKSARKRRGLQEHVDTLKMDLGWMLLDCKEYEKGLGLISSISWTTHGEMKCNGMVRALTEMGRYDEARGLLERGMRLYPNS